MTAVMTDPVADRKAEAEAVVAEANARKAQIEARKAEIDLIVPKIPTDVPVGSLTPPEKPSPLATLAAYRALSELAEGVGGVVPKEVERIWIVSAERLARCSTIHSTVSSQTARLLGALNNANECLEPRADKQAIGAAFIFPVIAAAIGNILPGLLSALRTTTTVRATDITLEVTAAATDVGQAILKKGSHAVYIDGISVPPTGTISQSLVRLEDARDQLAGSLVEFRAEHTSAPSEETARETARLEALKTALQATKSTSPELIESIATAAGGAAKARIEKRAMPHWPLSRPKSSRPSTRSLRVSARLATTDGRHSLRLRLTRRSRTRIDSF